MVGNFLEALNFNQVFLKLTSSTQHVISSQFSLFSAHDNVHLPTLVDTFHPHRLPPSRSPTHQGLSTKPGASQLMDTTKET